MPYSRRWAWSKNLLSEEDICCKCTMRVVKTDVEGNPCGMTRGMAYIMNGGNPVLHRIAYNIFIRTDLAGNIKTDKGNPRSGSTA